MAHSDGHIYWYAPDPRAILPLDNFHIPRRLKRTINKGMYETRINTAFVDVINKCAEAKPGRESTWIDHNITQAYTQLNHMGYAHSVETWQDNQLVGGLYGVAINGFFAGESMFSQARDASKVALVALVQHLLKRRFTLLDVQFTTPHLARFGVIETPRSNYHALLAYALKQATHF